jgi:glycosyltransferase involved in cell wall biosynthesis
MLRLPSVSIVMPVYNVESTLPEAITSILWQTFHDWELLLIDDGSSDSTLALAKEFQSRDIRIRVFTNEKNMGLASCLNQAIGYAQGKYVMRMDGDDVSYPERIERQIQFMDTNHAVDLLGTGAVVFDDQGGAIGLHPVFERHEEICRRPWIGFPLPHSTWFGRIGWFREYQYNPVLRKGQDQELLYRSYHHSQFASIPEALIGYRAGSLSMRKTLLGRYAYCAAMWKNANASSDYIFAARGTILHSFRGMRDMVGKVLQIDEAIMRRRYAPLDHTVRMKWEELWTSVNSCHA